MTRRPLPPRGIVRALLGLVLLAVLGAPAAAAPPVDPAGEVVEEGAGEVAPATRIVARLTLQVPDREAALERVVALARARGGWFASLSPTATVLRVPAAETRAFLDEAAALGRVLGRTYESTDLGPEITDLRARLDSRTEMLDRYMEVLEEASPESVVAVEGEISRAITEIEHIRGRLRYLDDRARFAEVTVSFRYEDRRAPVRDGSSSFPWLNTVNVADLQDDFRAGRRARPAGVRAVAPEGFAPYPKPARFQAVSPDDVLYRVRGARNRPRADLAFWREALRTRMADAGYVLLSERDVTADGRAGVLFEFGAAAGARDLVYAVAVFVRGGRLVVVEAAGEEQRFAAHRDAIVAAIEGIAF